MTASTDTQLGAAEQARMIPTSSAVTHVVVRVAGIVPVRLDLTHAGTPEAMLGLSLGTVLAYLRSAHTARRIADGWAAATVLANSLTPPLAGRQPVLIGPSTLTVIARLAGSPHVPAELHEGRAATSTSPAVPPVLVIRVGPISWQVIDQAAYTSLLRAWQQAARLLGGDSGDEV